MVDDFIQMPVSCPQSLATFLPTQQGHRTVWWKMHHLHPQCLVSLFVRFSDMMPSPLGAEKLEISRPPCVKPLPPHRMKLSCGPRWQWQTDNDWMLHFTSLTFFWKSIFYLKLSVEPEREREDKGWLRKITFSPPRTFYMKTHGSVWRTSHYRFTGFSRTNAWTPRYCWAHYLYPPVKKRRKKLRLRIKRVWTFNVCCTCREGSVVSVMSPMCFWWAVVKLSVVAILVVPDFT